VIQPDATRAADDEPAPESPAAGRSFPADLVVPLVLVLVPLWMTRHALQAYMPAGVDIGGHLVRTEFALELFRQGRLDGWFPGFGLGYRLFAVNGPGLALATGLVRLVCLGTITTAQAFTVLGIVSFATLPWAVAALGRELGASRLGSWLLGLLSLAVSFGAGGGLAALYRTGLLPNNLALPLQLVTLVALIRLVRDGGRRRAAIAALLVAALALLHPISVVVLALFAPLLLVSTLLRDPVRSAGRAFGAMLWAAALAAFWLLPALGHRDELGDATGWSIPPLPTRLGQILRGELLLPRAISVAVVVTLVATLLLALRQPAMRYRLLGPLAAVLYLTATHLALGHGFGPFELLIHLPNRGLALATILLMQPLAELVADVAGRLGRRVAAAPALGSSAGSSTHPRRPVNHRRHLSAPPTTSAAWSRPWAATCSSNRPSTSEPTSRCDGWLRRRAPTAPTSSSGRRRASTPPASWPTICWPGSSPPTPSARSAASA
jgi:uncharacterized membrane protein